jgi:hypothetical protein
VTTLRLLPKITSDFIKIRRNGYVYVDKTRQIYKMMTDVEGPYFLARPRRFGKSMLCSTIRAIFEGRRDLFGEIAGMPALAINAQPWQWKIHPVISIDLAYDDYSEGESVLTDLLRAELEIAAQSYGITVKGNSPAILFKKLIKALYVATGERVVVIIDEYDAPLISTLDSPNHEKMREKLKGFYLVLKACDAQLRFVFITGVSKFSKAGIFSGLNNLDDITLDSDYADICGITQTELLTTYGPEIDRVLEHTGREREEYLKDLQTFYNGYRFTRAETLVYNPFGMNMHFGKLGEFESYWFKTATPSFLIKLIDKHKINFQNLSDKEVSANQLDEYYTEDMSPAALLYQTGYLTITSYDASLKIYKLDFPNEEVLTSFAQLLVKNYQKLEETQVVSLTGKLKGSFLNGEIAPAMDALRQLLAGFSHKLSTDKEVYFQTVVFVIFQMLEFDCRVEEDTSLGRIDLTLRTKNYAYCFEFKRDKTAVEALAQIDTKEYHLTLDGRGRKVFKVGVNFSSKKRNIDEWKATTDGESFGMKYKAQDALPKTTSSKKTTETTPSQKQSEQQAAKQDKSQPTASKQQEDQSKNNTQVAQDPASPSTVTSKPRANRKKAIQPAESQSMSAEREVGREEGREEGAKNMLLTFLEQRFDTLPDMARDMVKNASPEKLQEWTGNFKNSTKLFEIFLAPANSPEEQPQHGEREETLRSMLTMLLKQRFNTLPDLAQDMLNNAPLQKLEEWTRKFEKSTKLFEIFL